MMAGWHDKVMEVSLKDQGNEFFKSGNYLKVAALYTQAISNPTLYRTASNFYFKLNVYFRKLQEFILLLQALLYWTYFDRGQYSENARSAQQSCAAFLHLVELNKALSDVETTVSLKPNWKKVRRCQGSRKWKHGHHNGFFIHFESPTLWRLWFIPSSTEQRDPVGLDISVNEILHLLFKQAE